MMANTFVKIADYTVPAGGQASIEFTSIPSTYTDLCLKVSARSSYASAATDAIGIRFNSSTSSYSTRRIVGTGSTVYSDSISANQAGTGMILVGLFPAATATSNTFGNNDIYIPNYAGSTNKSVSGDGLAENNATFTEAGLHAGLWANTAAITSVTLLPYYTGANFVQYSTAYLYGILKS